MSQHSFHLVRAPPESLGAEFRAIVAKAGGSALKNALLGLATLLMIFAQLSRLQTAETIILII
jgi:hypothetical protein